MLEAEPHPDADRLSVCLVDIGDGEPEPDRLRRAERAAGQTVAVAKPGAVMPDGTKLKVAKLRGQASNGMILAEDEVAIGDRARRDHGARGRRSRARDAAAGVLPISTDVLELEITPNRPDCLAIYGVAREAHAATGAALKSPPWTDDRGTAGSVAGASVDRRVPRTCARGSPPAYSRTSGSAPRRGG